MLAGPEDEDSCEWWQVRNVVLGIEGWLAQGGVVSSGDCLRWLLPLETDKRASPADEMIFTIRSRPGESPRVRIADTPFFE